MFSFVQYFKNNLHTLTFSKCLKIIFKWVWFNHFHDTLFIFFPFKSSVSTNFTRRGDGVRKPALSELKESST